jgi:hypothetical protein
VLSPERYPSRRHVAWRVLDTEAIVVDPKAGVLYPLNGVATRIWQLCDGEHSVQDIVERLAAEFEAPRSTIAADALQFLEALGAANLIQLLDSPRPIDHERPLGRER